MQSTTAASFGVPATSLVSTGLSFRASSAPARNRPISRHYQRSCSTNPRVGTPACSEHPKCTVGALKQFDPLHFQRPINKRCYWCPSFWVEECEREKGKKGTYLDWTVGEGFNQFWKEMLNTEEQFQKQWKSDKRFKEKQAVVHDKIRRSLSAPRFWHVEKPKCGTWRP